MIGRRFAFGALARWIALAAIAVALVPEIAAGSPIHHAGIVVRHGDGRMAYAYVAFEEESISGMELLQRSTIPLVTVSFGGLGEGVCSLDRHGCPTTDCRKRLCQGSKADDPFWKYFRQSSPGVWTARALGANATQVRDGDIDGWSWTGGEAQMPAMTLSDLRELTGVERDATPVTSETVPTPAVRHIGFSDSGNDSSPSHGTLVVGIGLLASGGAVALALVRRGRRSA